MKKIFEVVFTVMLFVFYRLMTVLSGERGSVSVEGNTLGDVIYHEVDATARWARETVTVLSGQNLAIGTVIGKILYSVQTSGAPAAGNAGGGTVSLVTAGAKVKKGVYTIECLSFTASPLDALFSVVDPDGNALPDAELGAYTNAQINFTIANGSPNIAAGDKWTITVAEGSGKVKGIDFDAVDGSQNAYGILAEAVNASSGDKKGLAIVRDCRYYAENLVYPTTSPEVTADEKDKAMADLAAKNIIPVDVA